MNYPVSKEKCSGCSMCSLVTKDISGGPIAEEEIRYQCLAMGENDCGGGLKDGISEKDKGSLGY